MEDFIELKKEILDYIESASEEEFREFYEYCRTLFPDMPEYKEDKQD